LREIDHDNPDSQHVTDPSTLAELPFDPQEWRSLVRHHLRQGSVYFGGESINAVTCVLAAIELSRVLPWFAASIRDIRMLRIEEFNDLMPAVQQAAPEV
jgi:virulence-associated protein VapD